MTLLDVIIWLVVIAFVVKGFMKGLISEVCSLLSLVAGGWAAFTYYPYLAAAFAPVIRLPHAVAVALAFLLIFLVTGLLFFLLGYLLTVILKIMLLGGINRVGGMLFGALEGAFILCIVLYAAATPAMPKTLTDYLLSGKTSRSFVNAGREIVTGWDARKPAPAPARAGK